MLLTLIIISIKIISSGLNSIPPSIFRINKKIEDKIEILKSNLLNIIHSIDSIGEEKFNELDNCHTVPNEIFELVQISISFFDKIEKKSLKLEIDSDIFLTKRIKILQFNLKQLIDFLNNGSIFYYQQSKQSFLSAGAKDGCIFEHLLDNSNSYLYMYNHFLCVEVSKDMIQFFINYSYSKQLIQIKFKFFSYDDENT